jgi:hypothetical protein
MAVKNQNREGIPADQKGLLHARTVLNVQRTKLTMMDREAGDL